MENLDELLEICDFRQSFNIQLKLLKEKSKAKLTLGHNGGIFFIDRSLLTFVELLISKKRIFNVVLLDVNENPIMIEDLEKFRDDIFDRYFTVTNDYHKFYQELKKSRSVKKLIGYE